MAKWTKEEDQLLRKTYPNCESIEDVKKFFPNRSTVSVQKKARKLQLQLKNFWSLEEIELLKQIYPNFESIEDAKKAFSNKSTKSIRHKAYQLKIKNTKIRSLNIVRIVKQNKERGRDLTFELVKEIASKFNCKTEFYINDQGAYSAAHRNGWMTEVCAHMKIKVRSIPELMMRDITTQLFGQDCIPNCRKAISPLELDVYFPNLSLAFEYDGIYWHKEENFKKELCREKSIWLVTIYEDQNIKNCYRKEEANIKKQLILNLTDINERLKTSFCDGDIWNIPVDYRKHIVTLEDMRNVCLSYTDLYNFRTNEVRVYEKLSRLGLIKEFTSHMTRKRIKWTDDTAKEVIVQYETLKSLKKENHSVYQWIKRVKKDYLLQNLKKKPVINI